MNISLSKMVSVLAGLNAIALAFLAVAFYLYQSSQADVTQTHENKYQSYLLADELRQSSDDLTRLARTYVITGAAKYEVQYFDILDIRNGKKPRPSDYHRIYWDFIAAGVPVDNKAGETVSLQDLMKKAGFTETEFKLLSQAQANSDGLVGLEVKAMNAVKGKFDDGSGAYAIQKDPDFKLARDLMHSDEYHTFKADIMKPVNKFLTLLETRTTAAVAAAESKSAFFGVIATIGFVIAAIVAFLTVWLVISRVIKGLERMKNAMHELSNGNMECEIPESDRHDEIGEMAAAVQVFKDGMIERRGLRGEAERTAKEQAEQKERDDQEKTKREAAELERQRSEAQEKESRVRQISEMITTFENKISALLGTLSNSASGLQTTANSMVSTADSSRSLSTAVASASHEASTNVETVAAAAEQLSNSITEISSQVQHASKVSEQAVEEAESSSSSVSNLAETANRISEVVDMISDIAEQTNLLALNATIEAARAGDAGKGFAVVASEVKNLATQTAKATEEIGSQIQDMQRASEGAVTAIGKIDDVIQSIREVTVSISSAVEEQSAATTEISRNVQEASNGTNEVSSKIEMVSDKSKETGSAATEVLSSSSELSNLATQLKTEIEVFLVDVRAA